MVIGEIRNDELHAAAAIKVTASFYTRQGTLIERVTVAPMLRVAPAGAKIPFVILFPEAEMVSGVSLRAVGVLAPERDVNPLTLASHKYHQGVEGFHHVTGRIRNAGHDGIAQARAVVTFYDPDAALLDATLCYARPAVLAPGAQATFACQIPDRGPVESYTVLVEGE